MFYNKIYKNNRKLDIIIMKKDEEDLKKTEEDLLNPYKNLDDNDWSSYKKKNFIIKFKIKEKKKIELGIFLIGLNINLLKKLFIFIKNYNKEHLMFTQRLKNNFKKNKKQLTKKLTFNFNKLLGYYKQYSKSILNKKSIINFYSNSIRSVVIIDIRNSKMLISAMNNDRCIFTLTPGIVFKKLQMKGKSLKKSNKMCNILLKTSIQTLKNKLKGKNYLINIKGTKNNIFSIVLFVKKNFLNENLLFIYSPHLIINGLKFKKVKSIKRRLKKKIIKFK